jgi:hypothetical protein
MESMNNLEKIKSQENPATDEARRRLELVFGYG